MSVNYNLYVNVLCIVDNPGPPHEYVSVRPSNLIDLNLNKIKINK